MNIYLNSKFAKAILLPSAHTIMFFGFIFSKKSELSEKEIRHEMCHVYQYDDCLMLGSLISTIALLICFGFQVISLHLLWLLAFPLLLFYIIYLIEFLVKLVQLRKFKIAYKNVGFERQAVYYSANNIKYQSLGWWSDGEE